MNASAENTTSDTAPVGPLTRCFDEPSRPATAVNTMAAYSPKRGSTPAMSAYAMLCGSEMAATVRPAMASARAVASG